MTRSVQTPRKARFSWLFSLFGGEKRIANELSSVPLWGAVAQGTVMVTPTVAVAVDLPRPARLMTPHQQPLRGYPLALFRFAQDALIRFDMAFLAAALHGRRVRFWAVLG